MANSNVSDETLSFLRGQAKIRELDLSGSGVTDRGLTHLAELKTLEGLRLKKTKVSDDGLQRLLRALPNLKRLNVENTAISNEIVDAWKVEKPGRRVQK
jgi:hypothetical protein